MSIRVQICESNVEYNNNSAEISKGIRNSSYRETSILQPNNNVLAMFSSKRLVLKSDFSRRAKSEVAVEA